MEITVNIELINDYLRFILNHIFIIGISTSFIRLSQGSAIYDPRVTKRPI